MSGVSRRGFLASAGIFSWLPWFRPHRISLAGAHYRIFRNGNARRRYLLIHGNEETARAVLTRHIETHRGILYVTENHTRNVSIEGGVIDPNRMFSRAGASANLTRLNPDWKPAQIEAALRILDADRDRLLRALLPPPGGLLVALHNNSENYSVNDEIPISDATSIREPSNPHAFFLCTNSVDYQTLAKSGYNVVLQAKAPPDDDGSLSRLAASRNIRYVNLEVRLGDFSRQEEMLDWLEWVLPEA